MEYGNHLQVIIVRENGKKIDKMVKVFLNIRIVLIKEIF